MPTAAPKRIVLVGFMGVGKTTVGAELGRLLGWTFRDLDDWIEERNGCSVADMFRDKGEPYFREQELQAAAYVHGLANHVIGAGGGAFVQPATRAVLQDGAVTVCLTCDLDAILSRIKADGSRPLAADRERMRSLMAQREAAYRLADLTVETTSAPPAEVAASLVRTLFPERGADGTERR